MILVAGGTGRLGRLVVERLQAEHREVRILTRQRARAEALLQPATDIAEGDVRDPASLQPAVTGVATVVSAIQGFDDPRSTPEATDAAGNRNLIEAAREGGVQHFVLMSVVGAAADHPMGLFRAKYAAEQALKRSGLAWTIIRATAFMEFWASLVGDPLIHTGRTRVFGRGRNPINFVSANDVADAVVAAVNDSALRGNGARGRWPTGPHARPGRRRISAGERQAGQSQPRAAPPLPQVLQSRFGSGSGSAAGAALESGEMRD